MHYQICTSTHSIKQIITIKWRGIKEAEAVIPIRYNDDEECNPVTAICQVIDDILLVCDNQTEANTLLTEFNGLHPNLRLTSEQESSNSIPFLDILITRREDGSIQRSIYRKSTWTGQYLNFHSFCPIRYKQGLVRT